MRPCLPLLSCLALVLLAPLQADAARHHARAHARKPPPARVRVVLRPPVHVPVQRCPGPDTVWVSGHPGQGGHWVSGHCQRVGPAPRSGWTYVSGYWNGRLWVSGFWRPAGRVGFTWVEAHVNDREEYVAGYWEPEGSSPEGMMWRPGYFDGRAWIAGGWVPTETYSAYDEDGELVFFAVGDGHVEELAIPEVGGLAVERGVTDPGDLAAEAGLAVEEGQGEVLERHASVPD